jgi:hypothetical protein
MDILSKLGIGIDKSIKPNDHSFGTVKERTPFLQQLKELLL